MAYFQRKSNAISSAFQELETMPPTRNATVQTQFQKEWSLGEEILDPAWAEVDAPSEIHSPPPSRCWRPRPESPGYLPATPGFSPTSPGYRPTSLQMGEQFVDAPVYKQTSPFHVPAWAPRQQANSTRFAPQLPAMSPSSPRDGVMTPLPPGRQVRFPRYTPTSPFGQHRQYPSWPEMSPTSLRDGVYAGRQFSTPRFAPTSALEGYNPGYRPTDLGHDSYTPEPTPRVVGQSSKRKRVVVELGGEDEVDYQRSKRLRYDEDELAD